MSGSRRGLAAPRFACALLGALALTSPTKAADVDGYPPGLFERSPERDGDAPVGPGPQAGSGDAERDFSGSPPAYRAPGPSAPGQAGSGEAERDFSGSPPAYRLPLPGEPGEAQPAPPAPQLPATAEAPPYDEGPPVAAAPTPYATEPQPFASVRPGGPPYGPPPGVVIMRRPPAYVYGPLPVARGRHAYGFVRGGPFIVAPPRPAYVYGPPFVYAPR